MSGEIRAPAMSVVLPTPSDFASVAATIHHLSRQTIAAELELIIVAMARPDFVVDLPSCAAFRAARVVHVGEALHGAAAAAGVRAAEAPVVVFAEDHCFPEPQWAEALVAAYTSERIAAVGPVFRNANPATLVSWCDYVIGYGPWIDRSIQGDQPFLAGHNSSYRRRLLLEYGPRLAEVLQAETVLHLELKRNGHRLVVEPQARAAHTNFGRFSIWIPVQFHSGRVFGGERARDWGWGRRIFYAVASPLIPIVRFARAIRHLHRSDPERPSLIRIAPMLALGLTADGLGQMLGYLTGVGGSPHYLTDFEFRRVDYVPESDRGLWAIGVSHP